MKFKGSHNSGYQINSDKTFDSKARIMMAVLSLNNINSNLNEITDKTMVGKIMKNLHQVIHFPFSLDGGQLDPRKEIRKLNETKEETEDPV
jgi:hypothetical protein